MTVYTAVFSAVAVSAAQDVFEITTPAGVKARIREIRLGQYSDFGDAQAEILSVTILRGHTTAGSGGTTPTPAPVSAIAPAASSTVKVNNTSVAANGSPVTLLADAWNVASGWWYCPAPDERIWLEPSTRLVVRITAPADSLTVNGTIVFEEGNSPNV